MSPLSDVVLYEDNTETRDNVFPRQLAVNDYMIQDPRYLQTYANFFCKFIDAYKEQGIPIDMIMYQNEADRKSTRLNSSHPSSSRMPSSA